MIRPVEIAPSITGFAARTPTLLPATHTNSYAIGPRDVVLVEPATPYEDEQRAWLEWARGLASQGRRAIAIVVTHHHDDHVGGLDMLSRELALPVWMHEETRKRVDANVPVARLLAEGDTIALAGPTPMNLRVLHTPGHAPGHVCLFDEASGAIVVGDMVASVGTILIAPGDGDMRTYIAQLERLAALDAKLALPAHGDPIASPTALFRRYVEHRLMREQLVYSVVTAAGARGLSIVEIVPRAYGDVAPEIFPIAALSVAAHIEKLVFDGMLVRDEDRLVATLSS